MLSIRFNLVGISHTRLFKRDFITLTTYRLSNLLNKRGA